MTRNGKIARLPVELREELSRRIQNGEQGKPLVEWLNKQPEVIILVHCEFGGRLIREQNLSEWKKGGYREWELKQDALAIVPMVVQEAGELKAKAAGHLSDHMAVWMTAQLVAVVRRLAAAKSSDAAKLKLLHEACADIVALRKGDQNAEWLEIEHERLTVAIHDVELKYKDVFEKYKKRTVIGLETLMKSVEDHPEAKAAMLTLAKHIKVPFDTIEGAP